MRPSRPRSRFHRPRPFFLGFEYDRQTLQLCRCTPRADVEKIILQLAAFQAEQCRGIRRKFLGTAGMGFHVYTRSRLGNRSGCRVANRSRCRRDVLRHHVCSKNCDYDTHSALSSPCRHGQERTPSSLDVFTKITIQFCSVSGETTGVWEYQRAEVGKENQQQELTLVVATWAGDLVTIVAMPVGARISTRRVGAWFRAGC